MRYVGDGEESLFSSFQVCLTYQDLTESYKPREGSVNERLALMRAVRAAGGDPYYRCVCTYFAVREKSDSMAPYMAPYLGTS